MAKKDKLEQLSQKLIKLQEELNKLKSEQSIKFKDIKVGDKFKYKELEFTKLSDELSIIDTYNSDFSDCIWDNVNNDYEKSLIRYYINNRYLDLMGIDRNDLNPVYNDDLATLLSTDEYKEYRDMIELWDRWWATRSTSSYIASTFYGINSYGYITNFSVSSSYGVRVCFNFKPDTIVS